MKNIFLILVVSLVSIETFSQTHLYENPDFDEIIQNHEIIGIIPFVTTIKLRPKQLKDFTTEQIIRMEKAEGKEIQNALHSWYLKRQKRGSLTVKVQTPRITNTKLRKAGVTDENIEDYLPEELAKILGVDGIIMGTFHTSKPMSQAAAIASAFLLGLAGSANKATINLYVYNGIDSELLINYNKTVRGGIGRSVEDLIHKILRKTSRRISYTKGSIF